jgi:hypothetical protein
MNSFHAAWAWVVVGANVVAGGWALAAHYVEPRRSRLIWGLAGIEQITIVVQVGLGAAIVDQQERGLPGMHAFYGFVAIAAAGIMFSYRSQLRANVHLLYGWGGLVLAGLSLRAIYLPAAA